MPYECFYTDVFVSDIEALDAAVREAAIKKIAQIRGNPSHFEFLNKAARLQKARIGAFRIIFRVDGSIIRFYRVGKRDIIYRELGRI
jgi:mRNA-degrading endonuclease RelE of RelBE toxin-antitoxin system